MKAPRSRAAAPTHSRWFWIRPSSAMIVRTTLHRGVWVMPKSVSTAPCHAMSFTMGET